MIREDQIGNPIYDIFTVNSTGENLTRITKGNGESDILPILSRRTHIALEWQTPTEARKR